MWFLSSMKQKVVSCFKRREFHIFSFKKAQCASLLGKHCCLHWISCSAKYKVTRFLYNTQTHHIVLEMIEFGEIQKKTSYFININNTLFVLRLAALTQKTPHPAIHPCILLSINLSNCLPKTTHPSIYLSIYPLSIYASIVSHPAF